MPGNEAYAVEQFIYSRLSGDSALAALVGTRIYARKAPQSTTAIPVPYPFVIYQQMSAIDDTPTLPGVRVMVNSLYLIKGINQENSFDDPLFSINARIDAVLQRASNVTNSNGQIFFCSRENPFQLLETDPSSGRDYAHLGGIYRIYSI